MKSAAARIAGIYVLVGVLWILFSDRLLDALVDRPAAISHLQTYKGWFYVVATGWMLYLLIAAWSARQQKAEEARRESEERYRRIVETAEEGVWILDPEGRTNYVNSRMAKMLGYPATELIGCPMDALVDEASRSAFVTGLEAGRRGSHDQRDVRLRRKDGSAVWAILSSSPIQDRRGRYEGALVMVTDISDRMLLQEQLLQAQKMEAIGRLAGGVAHDFNNLLTAILGYTELAAEGLSPDHEAHACLQNVRRAAGRAADLTGQLLAFARKQIVQPKVVELNALICDASRLLRPIIGEDVELKMDMQEDLGRVKLDPGQFEQVLVNMAVNARDAMPDGGKLLLETRNIALDDEFAARHIGVPPGRYVMLAVSDTGHGMTQEVQARLFEPFFTTKDPGKGTGLGLATCYGIVKQAGGSIWPYSEPGRGTTFKIYLPRVYDANQPADELEPPTMPLGTETVLLAEDEALVRGIAAQTLRSLGYTVIEATNGREALQVLDTARRDIALVITDVIMPEMGGRELAGRLRALVPNVPVLFTSGYTDGAITAQEVGPEGRAFLQKPFTPGMLARAVRAVLDTKTQAGRDGQAGVE